MVNGLGNLLSFVDTNVSSNSSSYNLNNYSYDDSFANMLNKTQNEDIYSVSSSVSNKAVERRTDIDKSYAENNYNSYDDYNNSDASSIDDKFSSDENTVKIADNSSNTEEKSKITNAEEKAARNKSDEAKTLAEDNKYNADESDRLLIIVNILISMPIGENYIVTRTQKVKFYTDGINFRDVNK